VLLVALGLFFNLDSFAQQGKQVKVANNNELIKALENPNPISIEITQDGYYDAIQMSVSAGTAISFSRDVNGGRSDCTLSVEKTDVCFDPASSGDWIENTSTASTSGTSCPTTPSSGDFGWSYSTTGSGTLRWAYESGYTGAGSMTNKYDETAYFEVNEPGEYTITYKWDLLSVVSTPVLFFEQPIVTLNPVSNDHSCVTSGISIAYSVSNSYAPPVGDNDPTIVWTVEDGNTPPNSVTMTAPTASPFTFNPSSYPALDQCGYYTITLSATNDYGPCETTKQTSFYLYDTPDNVDAGLDQTEVCYNSGYSTSVTGSFGLAAGTYDVSCDDGNTPTVLWSSLSGEISFGTDDANTTTVTSTACGTYTLTYTVTNGDCTASDDVTITFKALPTLVNAGDDADVCLNSNNEYTTTIANASFTDALCSVPADNVISWSTFSTPPTSSVISWSNTAVLDPTITVDVCGTYVFQMDVTNGTGCSVTDFVTVNFYDLATGVVAGSDQDICEDAQTGAYTANLDGTHTNPTCGTASIEWSATTVSGVGTLTFDHDDIDQPVATATACGEYLVTYTVTTGGPTSCSVSSTLTLKFYDLPDNVQAGTDKDVCETTGGFTTSLSGSFNGGLNTVSCDDGNAPTVLWTKVSGTGTIEFDGQSEGTTNDISALTSDQCGEFVLNYAVTNGPSCTVSDNITVTFYALPDQLSITANDGIDVCGYTTSLDGLYNQDCSALGTNTYLWETTSTPTGGSANFGATVNSQNTDVTVTECGDYTFKFTVTNMSGCESEITKTIHFYEAPDPAISTTSVSPVSTPTDPYACSEVTYYVINDVCGGNNGVIDSWTVVGGTFPSGGTTTTGTSVTVNWAQSATTVSLNVSAEISATSPAQCINNDLITFGGLLQPTISGQVKYWNATGTFMPSPFPTDNYSTYPEDYFYVTLFSDFLTSGNHGVYTVQPYLAEVNGSLVEHMSYYGFDLPVSTTGCNTEFYVEIYDGGLTYHTGVTPPSEETILGASYTYNNWGGVNATDALAMQYMGVGDQINDPTTFNYTWVGNNNDNPVYGYYSNSIADVNSSNSISALDALITNYRSVGLLGSYPSAASGTQFNPNFRVTGRMATALTDEMSPANFATPFSSARVTSGDDVPFTKSTDDYLYFSQAKNQEYKSANIDWKNGVNYMDIYYEAIGDVNASYVPTSAGFKAQPNMELVYEGIVGADLDSEITIPVTLDRDAELGAITLSFNYRNDLIEVLGSNYSDDNMFINHEEGILNIGWFSTESIQINEDATVAQIRVRVIAEIPENTELFELGANTELADATATPIDVNLKTIGITTDKNAIAGAELVSSNYPNPFKNSTTINYTLPESGKVKVEVYNNMGVLIATLVEETQEAGIHNVIFDRNVEAGVYIYSVTVDGATDNYSVVKRMIVVN